MNSTTLAGAETVNGLVVESGEPMHLARALMGSRYRTPAGRPGLRFWRGSFYQWYGGKWTPRTRRWVENDLFLALENVSWSVAVGRGQVVTQRCAPDSDVVAEVARALEVIQEVETKDAPCWLGGSAGMPDPSMCVAFQDVIVDVAATARAWDGVSEDIPWVTRERTEDYFEPVVLPVNFDPEAQCPVYRAKLAEWFGDAETLELFARVSGMVLLPTLKFQRGPAFIGKIRGGKGVNCRIYKRLLGDAYFGTSMKAMSTQFGMQGTEGSRAIVVSECTDLDSAAGQVFAGLWKNIIGMDESTVAIKYEPQVKCVLNAKVVLVSNQIPKLPNKGEGMSGKMLFVPFDHSFRGREDLDLDVRLEEELAGIAVWMLRGAVRLEKEPRSDRKWPVSPGTQRLLDQYRIMNNPFDAFLQARFVRSSGGRVLASTIREQWNDWIQRNRVRMSVSDNHLLLKLETESTWELSRCRIGAAGSLGMRGLDLRADVMQGEVEDEV